MALSVNYPPNPSSLVATAVRWLQRGDKIALLTLVNIEGSAPYPVGSQMLVNQNGEYRGQITGGCVESALADQAVIAITSGTDVTHRYGLDSQFFDIQLPCGSGIDVFFDVTTTLEAYSGIASELWARRPVQLSLQSGVGAFSKAYYPTARLIVFGQGPILLSLVQLALITGFEVICFAQKEGNLQRLEDIGINANPLRTGQRDFLDYCDAHTGLVSLFHEHDFESDILAAALTTELFYIGALGSRRTQAARLQALREISVDEHLLSRIFGPVGLDIGAETPAQIAVSILAQLIGQIPGQHAG